MRDRAARANKPQTVGDEFLRFLTFSSVRGVPRLLRARSLGWSVIWAVSVLGFLTVSFYFTIRLVMQFSTYQTVYEIKNEFNSQKAPFPSVTICNLQPFSATLLDRIFASTSPLDNVTADMYNDAFLRLQASSEDFRSLTWKSFFLRNWGRKASEKTGLKFYEFVLNNTCNFTYSSNSKLRSMRCDPTRDVQELFSSRYLTCFMLSPPQNISNSTFSVEMDMYLDTESSLFNRSHLGDESKAALFTLEDSIGAFVMVHTARTYPEGYHGVHVLPGTKSVIEITSVNKEVKLEHFAKDPCTRKLDQDILALYQEIRPFAYKSTICRRLMIQRMIARSCNCTDPNHPVPEELASQGFCGEVSQDAFSSVESVRNAALNATIKKLVCGLKIELSSDPTSSHGETQCPQPCEEISYRTTAYQSLWPPKSNEIDFYRYHIKGNSHLASKFKVYAEASALIDSGRLSEATALLDNLGTDLIRENFLRLHVFRPDIMLTISEEKLQITLEALISQIGGAFSLWAGLTIITTVELIELLYYVAKRVVVSLSGARPATQSDDGAEAAPRKQSEPGGSSDLISGGGGGGFATQTFSKL
ncbi:hypothetical protein BOX15_Mlig028639g1 [Macrostomum lignano]|uniref:Amiloride-sensitive sodium channel n=1 Tax=Macrostomum lignano TaxID=282301 RepID=A0A267EK74_9PLAT|nr:hypothetical protein BOX15_Mlig028639g1 [Macrostomum lignano]